MYSAQGVDFSFKIRYNESMEREIWKSIKGHEGIYSVSSFGRVRSEFRVICRCNGYRQTIREKILRFSLTKCGYASIPLSGKNFRVHRLVAEAFIPNPDNKETVNHIDGVKLNNRLENLEWATRSEQSIHAIEMGLHKPPPSKKGEEHSQSKITEFIVMEMVEDWNNYKVKNLDDLCNKYKLSKGYISVIFSRKCWKHLDIKITRSMDDGKVRGVESASSVLSEDEVRFIRENVYGESQRSLAKKFNVSPSNIYYIQKGKTWKHLI